MTRIAAAGDLHLGEDDLVACAAAIAAAADRADVLLLAGDLTRGGDPSEARFVVDALRDVSIPILAVLGNHDHHGDQPVALRRPIERAGVIVLEGESATVKLNGASLGVAGVKGFGGGFVGASVHEFGEPETKAFVRHTRTIAESLATSLDGLRTDHRVALLHYSPVEDTLRGEQPALHPFLGSSLLAEAIDAAGADLAVHAHAHHGAEHGLTPGGVRVRNVAMPVLCGDVRVYDLAGAPRLLRAEPSSSTAACAVALDRTGGLRA